MTKLGQGVGVRAHYPIVHNEDTYNIIQYTNRLESDFGYWADLHNYVCYNKPNLLSVDVTKQPYTILQKRTGVPLQNCVLECLLFIIFVCIKITQLCHQKC